MHTAPALFYRFWQSLNQWWQAGGMPVLKSTSASQMTHEGNEMIHIPSAVGLAAPGEERYFCHDAAQSIISCLYYRRLRKHQKDRAQVLTEEGWSKKRHVPLQQQRWYTSYCRKAWKDLCPLSLASYLITINLSILTFSSANRHHHCWRRELMKGVSQGRLSQRELDSCMCCPFYKYKGMKVWLWKKGCGVSWQVQIFCHRSCGSTWSTVVAPVACCCRAIMDSFLLVTEMDGKACHLWGYVNSAPLNLSGDQ